MLAASELAVSLYSKWRQGSAGRIWHAPIRTLLAYTKRRENPAEQVIGGKFAGYLPQVLLGIAQVFGGQLSGAGVHQLRTSIRNPLPGPVQGIQVAAACNKRPLQSSLVSHTVLEMAFELLNPHPCSGGQGNDWKIRVDNILRHNRRISRVCLVEDNSQIGHARQALEKSGPDFFWSAVTVVGDIHHKEDAVGLLNFNPGTANSLQLHHIITVAQAGSIDNVQRHTVN